VIASTLCARLAAARPVRLAPTLPYGSSGEHADFDGTLSIGQEALELVLVELARSYPGPVLFVCAHGGNAEPVRAALARVENARAWFPRWGGDAHAGRTETSLMLAIAPELVELDAAAAGNPAPLASLIERLREDGVRALAPNGVLGDPAGASAAEGERLLATAVDDLRAALAAAPAGLEPAAGAAR
jgi:mycofactocin precursor peptide peptidase